MNETITLNTAFKLRNQIKTEIAERTELLREMPLSYEDGTELDLSDFGGKKVSDVTKEIDTIRNVLTEFNKRISEANARGPEGKILEINGINDSISLFNDLYYRVSREPRESVETNGITGVKTRKSRTQIVDVNLLRGVIKTLRKEKVALETELSELNGITEVSLSGGLNAEIENILK